jgi:cell division transport system ATP-binding protein
MILFDDVTKKYSSNVTALKNINLKINDGEFVFLVGQSGAGKTTMLKLIIGEIKPDNGTICVNDWEVNKLKSNKIPYLRRKIGYVFQDFKLLNDRTIKENILISLDIQGIKKSEAEDKVKEVLKKVHLIGKDEFFPKQLSLGEQQRVSIARAIVADAKIVLADEPTGNLDQKTSWEILKIFTDINKNGTTVIMATHNVDIVNSMKKRVITLNNGELIKDEQKSKYH